MKWQVDDRNLKSSIITVFHPESAFMWSCPGDGRLHAYTKFYEFSELKEKLNHLSGLDKKLKKIYITVKHSNKLR